MSRLLVLSDGEGTIKAAVVVDPPATQVASDAVYLPVGIEPGDGEELHEVTPPEELSLTGALTALDGYRLERRNGKAQLTRRA